MKILIADDYADTLQIYAAVLQRAGHEVVGANDGVKAWEAFYAAVYAGAPFDLLLLDVAMPEMDGLECARRIRHFETEQRMIPTRLIFLSAHLEQVAVEDVARLGIHAVVQKPIGLDELRALCQNGTNGN